MKKNPVYKQHRIHTEELASGLWLVSIVNFGNRKMTTDNSLTDAVTRIPREYNSEEQAIRAAKEYIDQQAVHEQEA
ncbi:MAG: hypothetical protein ACHQ7N_20275 [Candidatus Methylomirabilales bacterium]